VPADPIDDLFAASPEEFVARRDALAKQLKADGDKDAAAEVKALRRPTVAAWAVNQVARSSKQDVAALLEVGDRLRDAHDALLDGKGDAGIRDATAERRKLVAKLAKAAVALLPSGGEAQRDAISHTFDAAVADPDAGLLVRSGRLTKELEAPAGFGGGLVFGVGTAHDLAVRTAPGRPTGTTRKPAGGEAKPDRAADAQQAARHAAAARQEVSRLQDQLVTANAEAKAAAEAAQLAQWKASTAQSALRDVGG
jgi:hypothetical protein